jgi:hypothetical protein
MRSTIRVRSAPEMIDCRLVPATSPRLRTGCPKGSLS